MSEEKIDFVIAWVDGNDPLWQAEKAKYDNSAVMKDSNTTVRYRDWDNLRYWFRSVEKFAPWVNIIHFITWGHLPPWLNTAHPKLNIVNHRDYIPEKYLPTFSSHTIELNIHRIDGLSDKFVYFNDDMFITKPVTSEDFFKDGLPCDTFGLNCIYFGRNSAGHFNGSNMEVINTEFENEKSKIMKRDFSKWFSVKNGPKNVMKSFLLAAWEWFPGFNYDHLPSDLLKKTYEKVWDKYYNILDKTCMDKFRRESNVNQWLFKYWQFCEGNYKVRSYKFGKVFHIEEDNFESACRAITGQKYKMICINDTSDTKNFEEKRLRINECFNSILSCKSSYEI